MWPRCAKNMVASSAQPGKEVEYTPVSGAAPQIAAPKPSEAQAQADSQSQAGTRTVRYRVRRGDNLYGISRRYKAKIRQIREWNPKLKGRRYLYAGEILILKLPVQP